jgi:hypothetical protein
LSRFNGYIEREGALISAACNLRRLKREIVSQYK